MIWSVTRCYRRRCQMDICLFVITRPGVYSSGVKQWFFLLIKECVFSISLLCVTSEDAFRVIAQSSSVFFSCSDYRERTCCHPDDSTHRLVDPYRQRLSSQDVESGDALHRGDKAEQDSFHSQSGLGVETCD